MCWSLMQIQPYRSNSTLPKVVCSVAYYNTMAYSYIGFSVHGVEIAGPNFVMSNEGIVMNVRLSKS